MKSQQPSQHPAFLSSGVLLQRRTAKLSPSVKRQRKPLCWKMCLPKSASLQAAVSKWGLNIDPMDKFGTDIAVIHTEPPMLRVENFITPKQCAALIELQNEATDESDLYLNYRVNKEVNTVTASTEAEKLISEFSASRETLNPSMRSGFRSQVPCDALELQPVLKRVKELLGFMDRDFMFAEGLWTRPNRRTVVVRDQTTVSYSVGEGVAPHVDGKDITVLICLKAPEEGGRTVFPEEGIAIPPVDGVALVYESKKKLLHFAEAVESGQKWVLQLLIDFRVRRDEPDVDFLTGVVHK